MGDLILMTRPAGPSRERVLAGESAEILFFTGVRYYRMEEEVFSKTIVKRRRSDKVANAAAARRARRLAETASPVSA